MIESDYFKDSDHIIKTLMRIPALKGFEDESLQDLLQMSAVKKFKSGELIFEEGSYSSVIYYLVSGKARIVKGGKKLIVLQRTGDIFGEMGPLEDTARSASVYAIDETVCIEIDVSNLDKKLGDDRYAFKYIIFRGFAEVLPNRLRITTEELLKTRERLLMLESEKQKKKHL